MAHIHEKIDLTVSVYVVCGDRVLVRKHEKYHRWLAVGGHVELDEDSNAAAIRETKEEVGLDVTLVPPPHWRHLPAHPSATYRELVPPLFLNIHAISETHQHHDLSFAAMSDSDIVVPEHPDDEWLWLTEAELLAHPEISDRIKHYAKTALCTVRGLTEASTPG